MFQDVFDLPHFDREPGDFSCGYFFRFILFVGRFLLLLLFLFGDEMKSLNSEMTNMRSEMIRRMLGGGRKELMCLCDTICSEHLAPVPILLQCIPRRSCPIQWHLEHVEHLAIQLCSFG